MSHHGSKRLIPFRGEPFLSLVEIDHESEWNFTPQTGQPLAAARPLAGRLPLAWPPPATASRPRLAALSGSAVAVKGGHGPHD